MTTRLIPFPLRIFLVASALASTGCADDELDLDVAFGRDRQPIVQGQVNNGDPAVVALTAQGQQFCTGTLIRPDVVITAAHCLPPNVPFNYTSIDVFFGTDVNGPGEFAPVASGWTHPGWNDNEFLYDIGLVRLAQPVAVAPVPFRTDFMGNDMVGTQVRITGFGITQNGANDSGLKRVATTEVSSVYQGVFDMAIAPSGTCSGDSGGPAFIMNNGVEELAGIHSRSDCVSSAIDTTVPDYLDDIYAFLGETPGASCDQDGQCAAGCTAPDPDCPCATDGFCTVACTDNAADQDCNTQCAAANGMCNMECPPDVPDPDCNGQTCEADGNCDPSCVNDPDCGDVGGTCAADGQCDETCGADPDCWSNGLDEEEDYDEMVGGCTVSHDGRSEDPAAWWLVALGVVALRRRR